MRTKRAFKIKQKAFFITCQVFSVARNCLRPETISLTILAIKKCLLCNLTNTLNGYHFMGHSGMDLWNFQLLLISKSSKVSSPSFLKILSKIPILDLNKRVFFQILLYIQSATILESKVLTFDYSVMCNILKWIVETSIKKYTFLIMLLRKTSLK